MTTFENIEVSNKEIDYILKTLGNKMTKEELMDNLTKDQEVKGKWNVRLSRVSAKDLPEHDNKFFTDGNHNGRCALIPFMDNKNEI